MKARYSSLRWHSSSSSCRKPSTSLGSGASLPRPRAAAATRKSCLCSAYFFRTCDPRESHSFWSSRIARGSAEAPKVFTRNSEFSSTASATSWKRLVSTPPNVSFFGPPPPPRLSTRESYSCLARPATAARTYWQNSPSPSCSSASCGKSAAKRSTDLWSLASVAAASLPRTTSSSCLRLSAMRACCSRSRSAASESAPASSPIAPSPSPLRRASSLRYAATWPAAAS
mmetsp:Transcript_17254/g.59014  ORF Transcript_17254/g.59014 Transcript_17254/m.59014 type:complete len:228 (-) Transcript_17254:425-1108(-)